MGEQNVKYKLCVESPISRVMINEDGVNFETSGGVFRVDRAGEWPRMNTIVVEEVLGERPDGGVRRYYISRSYDVAESVSTKESAWLALKGVPGCKWKKRGS